MKKNVVSPEEIDDLMIMFGETNAALADNSQRTLLTTSKIHKITKIAEDKSVGETGSHPFEEISGPIELKINKLESILERLELISEVPEPLPPKGTTPVKESALGSKIFVHGHDESAIDKVARLLGQLDLKPIILHEQQKVTRTIIEICEDYSDVGYAVVIMTPDDVGASANQQDNLEPRARQNVILELGYFLGKLGRNRVCILYKGDVEIPADYTGVLYIPMDDLGAWKTALAMEIKTVGIEVDLNKLVG